MPEAMDIAIATMGTNRHAVYALMLGSAVISVIGIVGGFHLFTNLRESSEPVRRSRGLVSTVVVCGLFAVLLFASSVIGCVTLMTPQSTP